jgi:formate dehydrogenase subunit gamma
MRNAIPWNSARAREIIEAHLSLDGPALPILHALQHEFGFVPDEAVPLVAEGLNLSRAEMHGVVTFYHDFHRAPAGRHVLRLCRAEACQSLGGNRLADDVRADLRIGWGETSADGRITLEPVFCLGLCACAPAAMLDGKVVGRLDPAKLSSLIGRARLP